MISGILVKILSILLLVAVGLVLILLEKGLLDDYDVDAFLVESTETVAFARTTTDPNLSLIHI